MTQRVALLTAWAPARTNNSDSWPQIFMTIGAMTGHIGQSGRHDRRELLGIHRQWRSGAGQLRWQWCAARRSRHDQTVKINNNELWDAVLNGKYTAGYQDVKPINIQMIIHDGGSALNQKVGMTKGIAAHREVEFVLSSNFNLNTNCQLFRRRPARDHAVGARRFHQGQPRASDLGASGHPTALRSQG